MQQPNVTISAPAIATRDVEVCGLRVRYQVVGSGEPVILVHGLSGSSRWWMRNIPVLAPHYQLYLVDLPGFGAMRRHRRHFVLTEAAAWLLAWMEALDLHQTHVIGHSMGGYISARLAAARPSAVRRLVLVAPAGTPAGRSLPGYFIPLLLSGRYAAPRFLPVLLYDTLRAGPRTVLRAGMALLAEDLRVHLEAITAPTLLVWGEYDPLVPHSIAEVLCREIRDSRLLILKGAGHVPMFDRPREFNAAILRFLAGEPDGE